MLLVRQLKLAIQTGVGLPSPFLIQLLLEQEKLDDFVPLQSCTNSQELRLSLVFQRRRRPTPKEFESLAEAIGNNFSRTVWRILARGLVLMECIPTHGRMTINPIVLALQSPYPDDAADRLRPNIITSLLQANCDPNHCGHPPKSPLAEAALRNYEQAVQLMVPWKGDVNLQARGSDLPLVTAVKQKRTTMVKCLLDLRADPTVTCYANTRHRGTAPAWGVLSVQQLTTPGSSLARIIEEAVSTWQSSHSSQ